VTTRGRTVLGLGVLSYAAAWAFGSKPLYPVAVGLLLAAIVAWAWVHLANKPVRLRRPLGGRDFVEGDDVPVEVSLELMGAVPPASATLVERVARVGERRTPLERKERRLWGRYVLEGLPRGRYVFEETRLELEDAFGLERVEAALPAPGALLVYPRLVHLDRLFSEAGAAAPEGRRLLLRRPSGFDLHSVREYEQGESLRKVHWRSTAKRGQLMVKELEDAPRDEVAVLLDADREGAHGEDFDLLVRAAGSILHAHVRRGRRAVLVVNGAERVGQRVHSDAGDWRRAYELLAAVEPAGRMPAAALLAGEASPAARALELTVATARLTPQLVDRLVQRHLSRRSVSVVFVQTNGRPEPQLLKLQAAGLPLAILRRGDDLAEKLGARVLEVVAHG
jgi:uncharacterized protein (DUF58 family)